MIIKEVIGLATTGLLQWTYQYILEKHLNSDSRGLAVELRMQESAIERALNEDNSIEYSLLFEQLLAYCSRNGISIDAIMEEYARNRQ